MGEPERSNNAPSPQPSGRRIFFLSTFTSTSVPLRFEVESKPDAPPEAIPPLFELPEYSRAFMDVFADVTERLAEAKSPVLKELVTRGRGEHVHDQIVRSPDGEAATVKPRLVAMPYQFYPPEIIEFDLDALGRSFDVAANTLVDEQLEHMLDTTSLVAEVLGQTADAGGERFGWAVLLRGFAQVAIDFDDDDKPILPRMVGEWDKRNFLDYPPLTDEHRPAFERLMEQKRREYHARRSGR